MIAFGQAPGEAPVPGRRLLQRPPALPPCSGIQPELSAWLRSPFAGRTPGREFHANHHMTGPCVA
jgi:hypothetical protein